MTEPLDDPLTNGLPEPGDLVGMPGHDTATNVMRGYRATRLRAMGATWQQVADAEGYSDPSNARRVVMNTLRRHEAEAVADLRKLEDERLNLGLSAVVPLLTHADPHVRLKAHAELMRNSKRRADMWGLDAPKQIVLSAGVQAELEKALADLTDVVMGEATDVVDTPLEA